MKISAAIPALALLMLFGCGGGGGSEGSSLPTTQTNPAQAAAEATTEQVVIRSFSGQGSRLIGRFLQQSPGEARFAWSGSALEFNFRGTGAELGIQDWWKNRFLVEIDGKSYTFRTKPGAYRYPLAKGLDDTEHHLRITRISGALAGDTAFVEDPKIDGKLLLPPTAPETRLLVIGDSITAAAGVEGIGPDCALALEVENQQLSYAAVAARELDADLHSLALSGRGIWRGYGEKKPIVERMPEVDGLILPYTPDSKWLPSAYHPNAIIVSLGSNDYWSADPDPSADFVPALASYISRLQANYPGVPIYLLNSSLALLEPQASLLWAGLQTATSQGVNVIDIGHMLPEEGMGCAYHPNAKTNARLGKVLAERLRKDLGL